jgi:hypothetical protein
MQHWAGGEGERKSSIGRLRLRLAHLYYLHIHIHISVSFFYLRRLDIRGRFSVAGPINKENNHLKEKGIFVFFCFV